MDKVYSANNTSALCNMIRVIFHDIGRGRQIDTETDNYRKGQGDSRIHTDRHGREKKGDRKSMTEKQIEGERREKRERERLI